VDQRNWEGICWDIEGSVIEGWLGFFSKRAKQKVSFTITVIRPMEAIVSIREFEIFHGCVITKILRSDNPISLRLIETKPKEHWSTYTLNDSIELFITYSTTPRNVEKQGGGTSWTFPFNTNQLRQILQLSRRRQVYIALVCGRRDLGNLADKLKWHICLLEPKEISQVISFGVDQQSITVRCPRNKGEFRIFKDKKQLLLIPQSRIDKWDVPNS